MFVPMEVAVREAVTNEGGNTRAVGATFMMPSELYAHRPSIEIEGAMGIFYLHL